MKPIYPPGQVDRRRSDTLSMSHVIGIRNNGVSM
jgi:hypothetical protein